MAALRATGGISGARRAWHRRAMAASPPTEASLREAALTHLARYATTRAGLIRVLDRRIDRWARAQEEPPEDTTVRAAKAAVREVVAKLAGLGAVNDAAFAESRARSLTRAGRSRRAIAAHLAMRGVDAETAATAMPADTGSELAAALAWTKRRRIGPFRAAPVDTAGRMKELGTLARAGFDRDTAERALDMPHAEAEAMVIRLRRA